MIERQVAEGRRKRFTFLIFYVTICLILVYSTVFIEDSGSGMGSCKYTDIRIQSPQHDIMTCMTVYVVNVGFLTRRECLFTIPHSILYVFFHVLKFHDVDNLPFLILSICSI